jgi:hypothetical protein
VDRSGVEPVTGLDRTGSDQALTRAMRRVLRDDSKVHGSLDGRLPARTDAPEAASPSPRPRTGRIVPILPELRSKAIRRSLRDESKVQVRLTDPRRSG